MCNKGSAHVVIFFFFSSRRRHTRFDCDWSSDVCSSDLERRIGVEVAEAAAEVRRRAHLPEQPRQRLGPLGLFGGQERSEERRVGKECRSRWGAEHYKIKGRKRSGRV